MKTTDNTTTDNMLAPAYWEYNAEIKRLQQQRDTALAALRQVRAILSQPCAIDSHGPKTLQILQGDCAIARQQIDAVIAATQGSAQ